MRHTLLIVAMLFLASSVSAQTTHPCDATPAANPSLTSPIIVQFCHDQRDTNNVATSVTSWKVTIDSTVVFTGALTPIGVISPVSGKWLYETAPIVPPPISAPLGIFGPHVVSVSGTNALGESVGALAFPFQTIRPPVPSQPTVVGVRK